MLNNSKPARKRRISNFLVHRATTPRNFNFVRKNEGSITFSTLNGATRCDFTSKKTGRAAFAFGSNFQSAYAHMISRFNLKYSISFFNPKPSE